MSSLGTTPGTHLQDLILNVNSVASNEQKLECVSSLKKDAANDMKTGIFETYSCTYIRFFV